jgi:hypothetical protein
MSTQKQYQPRSLEPVEKKPLQRTQAFLKELKITIGLAQDLFQDVKWERVELVFYRTVIAVIGIVELLKIFWHSIWH